MTISIFYVMKHFIGSSKILTAELHKLFVVWVGAQNYLLDENYIKKKRKTSAEKNLNPKQEK